MKQRSHAYCQNIKNALRGLCSREGAVVLAVGLLLVVLAVTTHTFQIPCSHFFTGNLARSATIGIYISKTRITSEA